MNRVKNKNIKDVEDSKTREVLDNVSPIYLNDLSGFDMQNAIVKTGLSSDVENAFKSVKENIEAGLLDFLSPFVYINHFGLKGYECTGMTSLKSLIENMPIYLVLHDDANKCTSDDKTIPTDEPYSYCISWDNLRNAYKGEPEDPVKKKKIRVLGMYVWDDEPAVISQYTDIFSHRRIFLWIDNIRDNSTDISIKANIMFTLYHELGHAIMDELKLVCETKFDENIYNDMPSLKKLFDDFHCFLNVLREESLANGLGLYALLHSSGVNLKDSFEIRKRQENGSVPYSLGISYIDKSFLEVCIPIWMNIKTTDKCLNSDNLKNWFTTVINNGPFIPWSILKPVEYNLNR